MSMDSHAAQELLFGGFTLRIPRNLDEAAVRREAGTVMASQDTFQRLEMSFSGLVWFHRRKRGDEGPCSGIWVGVEYIEIRK